MAISSRITSTFNKFCCTLIKTSSPQGRDLLCFFCCFWALFVCSSLFMFPCLRQHTSSTHTRTYFRFGPICSGHLFCVFGDVARGQSCRARSGCTWHWERIKRAEVSITASPARSLMNTKLACTVWACVLSWATMPRISVATCRT